MIEDDMAVNILHLSINDDFFFGLFFLWASVLRVELLIPKVQPVLQLEES